MNRLSKSFFYLLATVVTSTVAAQEVSTDKIQYKLSGRMLMDGGVFLKNENNFDNGIEFSDLWDMKVEIGYVGSKVSIKDAFIHIIRSITMLVADSLPIMISVMGRMYRRDML